MTSKGSTIRRSQTIARRSSSSRITPRPTSYAAACTNLKNLRDQAIADLTKAIEAKPNYAEAYLVRGKAYGQKKLDDEAIADYTKALEIKPDFAEAFANRGNAYVRKGLVDQSLTDYTKAIELKPDDAIAYNNRAWSYHLAGQDFLGAFLMPTGPSQDGAQACRSYRDPGGNPREKLGQRMQVIADYRQALSLYPDLKDAQVMG